MEKISLNNLEKDFFGYSFTSIFRTIACVGDSLSSGEFEIFDSNGVRSYYDKFEYSWGQYIGRKNGSTVYNFSRGGMTASEYCDSFAKLNDFWNPEKKAQAYIIALGVNDLLNAGQQLGSKDDIDLKDPSKNNKNFITYYSQIIQKYKEINKDAKFFLVTMPKSTDGEKKEALKIEHQKALYDLTKLFDNTYVVDLNEYGPVHDETFIKKYYLNGHLNPMGYILTAAVIDKMISNIILENLDDFNLVGMMN